MSKKRILVLDASVMVKWLTTKDELHIQKANDILNDLQNGIIEVYAPELCKYEIGNVLLKRKAPYLDVQNSFATFYSLPIIFVPDTGKSADWIYKIATELKITYYDASYIALAEQLEADLITENMKHHGKATSVKVISIANYHNEIL